MPIAALVVLGAGLLRLGFYGDAMRRGLDRLVYWVCLPALILQVLLDAPTIGGGPWRMAGVLLTATVVVMLLAYLVAWAFRVDRPAVGVLAQAAFRGNLAFVGLPVIALALGDDSGGGGVLARATLVFAPLVILYNVLGVVGLVAFGHKLDASLPWKMLRSLVSNPLLIACVVGQAAWSMRVEVPEVAIRTLGLLGQPAAPLALISLGGAVVSYPLGHRLGLATVAAALKLAALPLITWWLAGLVGLSAEDRMIAMVFAACPTAVASYVLATQLDGDEPLAAACIVVTTVGSAVSLAVVLGMG